MPTVDWPSMRCMDVAMRKTDKVPALPEHLKGTLGTGAKDDHRQIIEKEIRKSTQ